jgi:hypothetical protein
MESIESIHSIIRNLMIILKILAQSMSRIRDLEGVSVNTAGNLRKC